jgi:hypothetical protein
MTLALPAILLTAALGGAAETSLAALSWLAGSWVSEEGDRRIEEHWIPAAGGTMLGLSRTVVGNETVGFEFLRLESRPTGIFYIAHPGARPGTEFALTRLEGEEAVFENPAHDHPKIIRYRLEPDGTLLAVIEGDENGRHVTQDFHYRKAAP